MALTLHYIPDMNRPSDTAKKLAEALAKCCPVCGEEAETFDVPWPFRWSKTVTRMCAVCADKEPAGADDADFETYEHGEDQ